jgi:hypothetical protein
MTGLRELHSVGRRISDAQEMSLIDRGLESPRWRREPATALVTLMAM